MINRQAVKERLRQELWENGSTPKFYSRFSPYEIEVDFISAFFYLDPAQAQIYFKEILYGHGKPQKK